MLAQCNPLIMCKYVTVLLNICCIVVVVKAARYLSMPSKTIIIVVSSQLYCSFFFKLILMKGMSQYLSCHFIGLRVSLVMYKASSYMM